VVDYYNEPVKILSDVEKFSIYGFVKVARSTDGEKFVWGVSVKMSRPVSVGYIPDPDNIDDQCRAQMIFFDDYEAFLEYKAAWDSDIVDFEDSFIVPTPWDEAFESQ